MSICFQIVKVGKSGAKLLIDSLLVLLGELSWYPDGHPVEVFRLVQFKVINMIPAFLLIL